MKHIILSLFTAVAVLTGSNIQGNQVSEQTTTTVYTQDSTNESPTFISAPTYETIFVVNDLFCDKGQYAGGFGGINFSNRNGNVGFSGGLSLGYKFQNNLRAEGEFAYRYNRDHSVDYNIYSFMANALYDFNSFYDCTPYLGFGLGYARSNASVHRHNNSDVNHRDDFVMQGIVGASRKLMNGLHLGAEYRIFGGRGNVRDHSLVVSVKSFY